MGSIPVTYLTEDPASTYAKDIQKATTLEALRRVLRGWQGLADDALLIAKGMTERDFKLFRKGLGKERRGEFAGDTWAAKFSALLMPSLMFQASMTADKFKVPWGTAWIRLREADKERGAP